MIPKIVVKGDLDLTLVCCLCHILYLVFYANKVKINSFSKIRFLILPNLLEKHIFICCFLLVHCGIDGEIPLNIRLLEYVKRR